MSKKKILLSLMPFWSPLAPPLGISSLKSYLEQYDYNIVIHDFNTEDILWEILEKYMQILRDAVPVNRQGNFHMVGFDVLSNHLLVIEKNYFTAVDKGVIAVMDGVISEFYNSFKQRLHEVFREEKPDVAGISVYTPSLGPSLFAFKSIKEELPAVKTVMGGGVFADHLALNSPNFIEFVKRTESYIDNIIVGEGEILFEKCLSEELEPGRRVLSLNDINRENLHLEAAPIPDFSGLNLSAYSQMAIYATRSCPFQCGFCSETIQWGKFRKKKGERIADEIAALKRKYGGKLFMFGDSLMNQVIDDLSSHLVRQGMDIYWDGYLRTDGNVAELSPAQLWRKAGFYRARLGVESGSQHVLDLMDKKMTVEQIKKAVKNLAACGIKTTTYWVIGYPGEKEEDFRQTIELLTELKDDIYEADWHPFYFFPRGQVKSNDWTQEHDIELLYPEEFTDLLLTQTWILNREPGREEVYNRLNRFAEACKELGIPNPYSMMDIYQADKRWQQLHPGAGPPLLELHNFKHGAVGDRSR
jgi:radical SAM superfamily enzyme YgiQ (UPF0313 family)